MPEKNFKTFLAQATRTNTKIQECYAWHIANFDIVREEFVLKAILSDFSAIFF